MPAQIIARKQFTEADQARFAELSGDRNPIHMDKVAARRTQAGAPIVHGIHSFLWAFDAFAARYGHSLSVSTLEASFQKMVYVGDTVEAMLTRADAVGFEIELTADGDLVLRLIGTFGRAQNAPAPLLDRPSGPVLPATPVELKWEAIASQQGRVRFATPAAQIGQAFPAATRVLGQERISAIACCSCLVGMVCPGLHSIFGDVSFTVCEETSKEDAIEFRVVLTNARFRLVQMEIAGGGLTGTINSFARTPPVAQPAMAQVARLVQPSEFARSTALVVGGSRGLGELTAKLIAAGGGNVILTYTAGRPEAERVRAEITGQKGRCEIRPYDARQLAEEQLKNIPAVSSLYYFATPPIVLRKLFSENRLDEFMQFYVRGFYRLCQALLLRQPRYLSVFYPSTIYAESRPAGMTEYVMAKGAGEILCADMNAQSRSLHIHVRRLPRLLTDQTATVVPEEMGDACQIMLPIVREVEKLRT